MECKSLRESGEALRAFDVAYFAASCDPHERNTEFAKSLDLDYPILSDPGKEVAESYGVVHEGRGVPERWTFFISPQGKILYVETKVKAGNHGKDCVEKLTELKIAKKG